MNRSDGPEWITIKKAIADSILFLLFILHLQGLNYMNSKAGSLANEPGFLLLRTPNPSQKSTLVAQNV